MKARNTVEFDNNYTMQWESRNNATDTIRVHAPDGTRIKLSDLGLFKRLQLTVSWEDATEDVADDTIMKALRRILNQYSVLSVQFVGSWACVDIQLSDEFDDDIDTVGALIQEFVEKA